MNKHIIWMHFDGHVRSAAWPVANYKENGIFTSGQLIELESKFGLSRENLVNLSLWIGNALDLESMMNLVEVSPDEAVKAGAKALRRALRHVSAQPENPNNRKMLVDVLLGCSACFSDDPDDSACLAHAQELTREPHKFGEQLISAASVLLERPRSVALLSPVDKRRLRDGRREHITRSCCYAWLDAGRRLTYTTRPDLPTKAQRAGPLFDFIHAVMKLVTPEGRLPVDETIRKDIDTFRELIVHRPELLDNR